jgi:hypothetical protein
VHARFPFRRPKPDLKLLEKVEPSDRAKTWANAERAAEALKNAPEVTNIFVARFSESFKHQPYVSVTLKAGTSPERKKELEATGKSLFNGDVMIRIDNAPIAQAVVGDLKKIPGVVEADGSSYTVAGKPDRPYVTVSVSEKFELKDVEKLVREKLRSLNPEIDLFEIKYQD